MYSIGKSLRFKESGNRTFCQEAFYNAPKYIPTHCTGMGYGSKVDITKLNNSFGPGPNQYNLKREFETSAANLKKGFSIAPGRHVIFFKKTKNNIKFPIQMFNYYR